MSDVLVDAIRAKGKWYLSLPGGPPRWTEWEYRGVSFARFARWVAEGAEGTW